LAFGIIVAQDTPRAFRTSFDMATALDDRAIPRTRRVRPRWFYTGVSVLMSVLVLAGFGPSLYESLVLGTPRHWAVHLHAAVYVGWLALLIGQTVLAARGHIALHQRVGNIGIAYGVAMVILGFVAGLLVPASYVETGAWPLDRGASFLATIFADMALFGGFFGAAVAYRRRPEIHKRLMVLATVGLILPGVGRLWFIDGMFAGGPSPQALGVLSLIWLLPLMVAMVYDLMTVRRVHAAYWIGAAILIASFGRFSLGQTEAWRTFGRAMLAPLL
jgi:hypothetical protein